MFEQFFKGMPKDGKTYVIAGKKSGKAIAVDGEGRTPQTRLVLAAQGNAACQKFRLAATGENLWELTPVNLETCAMDVYCASTEDGAILWAYPKNNSYAQRFQLVKTPDGSFKILTETSDFKKAVVVHGDSSAEGAGIVQGSPDAASADWIFTEKE